MGKSGVCPAIFYIELDKPFEQAGIWEGDRTGDAPEIKGSNIGGWLSADRVTEVEARVGISFISVEQARQNLEKETGNKTFAAIREDSRQIWEKALGRIRVEGGTEREKRIFYTSLYRTYERMVNFPKTVNITVVSTGKYMLITVVLSITTIGYGIPIGICMPWV